MPRSHHIFTRMWGGDERACQPGHLRAVRSSFGIRNACRCLEHDRHAVGPERLPEASAFAPRGSGFRLELGAGHTCRSARCTADPACRRRRGSRSVKPVGGHSDQSHVTELSCFTTPEKERSRTHWVPSDTSASGHSRMRARQRCVKPLMAAGDAAGHDRRGRPEKRGWAPSGRCAAVSATASGVPLSRLEV